ncbi:hypothetical protein HSR6_2120 [Halodesulfurarchaeum formicicum]|uniref:DUF998 domain-containing protein n=2 Tax=Halodesulfurarchaeum formicicum TaxID=1873524 RepID=A0A1J1AFE3_9EURY|nr:hypothetical protein HSR6_2120 [Halodesulfurarchaeum formicicum]
MGMTAENHTGPVPTQGMSARSLAGLGTALAGILAFMGIITGEVLYPNYSTRQDISDLGSTRPPNPVIHEPAATIFNSTMVISGLCLLVAAYFAYRAIGRADFPVLLGVFGLGALGVGLFPGNVTPWHGLAALLTFFAGGLTAIYSVRIVDRPFAVLCGLLGGISLTILVSLIALGIAGVPHPLDFLGSGGVERWVAYPLLLWAVVFGGYLLGVDSTVG